MNENIFYPSYFDEDSINNSYFLSELFWHKQMNIEIDSKGNKYFNIDVLRYIYRENRYTFNKIVLELTLRGFIIPAEDSSSLFPKSYVTNQSKRIGKCEAVLKRVDFEYLRLGLLLNTFRIESSDFFKNIPLEGFLSINQYINLNLLEAEFIKAGFEIVDTSPTEGIKIEIPDILQIIHEKEYLHSIRITELKGLENRLDLFLKQNNLIYLYEINSSKLSLLYCQETNLYKKLLKYIKRNFASEKIYPYLFEVFTNIYTSGFPSLLVSTLFQENKFNAFRKFLSKKQIYNLLQVTPTIFEEFTCEKGVGVGKVLDVLDVLYDISKRRENLISGGVKKIENTPVTTVYLLSYLCFQSNLLDSFSGSTNIVDSQHIEKIKIKCQMNYKKKKFRVMKQEIEDSLKKIASLDVHKIKKEVQFDEKYGQLTLGEIINLLGIENDEFLVENVIQNDLLELMNITLNELDILYYSEQKYFKGKIDVVSLYKQLLWILHMFQYTMKNFDSFITNGLKDREVLIYRQRIIGNETLEEVGKLLGITRERVRQIEKKVKQKVEKKMHAVVLPGVRLYFRLELGNIVLKEQLDLTNDIIKLLENKNRVIVYDSRLELFYLNSSENSQFVKLIYELFDRLPNVVDTTKFIDYIQFRGNFSNSEIQFFSTNLNYLFDKFDYKICSDKYIIKTLSLSERLCLIIGEFDQQTLDISSSNQGQLELFRKTYETYFPEDSSYILCDDATLSRKLRGSFERSHQVILKEPSTFMLYDYRKLPYKLINCIHDYLTTYFEDEFVISYKKVYKIFQEELERKNITAFMMYYLLKYCYEQEFNFGKGNTMYIYEINAEKVTTDEIVYRKVDVNGGQMNKHQLSEELGFDLYTVEQAVSMSEKLVTVQGNVCATKLDIKIIPEKLKQTVRKIIGRCLEDYQFVVIKQVFNELKFNKRISEELLKAKIVDENDLLRIINQLYPELEGNTKVKYYKDSKLDVSDVILTGFTVGTIYTRQDVIARAKELGYAEATMYLYFRQWLQTGRVIEISSEEFVLQGSFVLSSELVEKVKNFLNNLLKDQTYVALYRIRGFRRKLPRIDEGYRWTPQLIRYIGKQIGFSFVDVSNVVANLDPIIVLSTNSNYKTYGDLLHKVLDNYGGNLHEEAVYEYLVEEGLLVARKKTPATLPEEVLNEELIQINEIGMVERND